MGTDANWIDLVHRKRDEMSSTKTVEERRSSPVRPATEGLGSLFKFKIPEAKYGVLLTALALSLIYIDGAPPFHFHPCPISVIRPV